MRIPAPSSSHLSRRTFLTACASAAVASTVRSADAAAPRPMQARRPKPPYRVWFQPLLFERDMSLYASMTIDASGWLDPKLAEAVGRTTLDWEYGLNHPEATGPETWAKSCSVAARSFPRKSDRPDFIAAGVALDEWTRPHREENVAWLCDGLREGRRANPEVFIAVWSTDATPPLIALAIEGVVDLIIVEGYTHCDPAAPPGQVTSWENALRRCDTLAKSGLETKTIFSFGHINGESRRKGERLSGAWLRERMAELKQRYPQMPGVAFFQNKSPDTPELRQLIRACDQLSAEFWPEAAK